MSHCRGTCPPLWPEAVAGLGEVAGDPSTSNFTDATENGLEGGGTVGAPCHLCTHCIVCKARRLLGLVWGRLGWECVSELDEQELV